MKKPSILIGLFRYIFSLIEFLFFTSKWFEITSYWFCSWTVITIIQSCIYKVYNMLYQLFLNTPTKLLIHFGLINHLVKSTKNATWKKNTMTPISCTTWPAALDPSSTPVIFLNGVVGVGVVEGGHPSRGHGGQSRGRFGFSWAHSGRGPPPPPPPPGPIPEFTQWQR